MVLNLGKKGFKPEIEDREEKGEFLIKKRSGHDGEFRRSIPIIDAKANIPAIIDVGDLVIWNKNSSAYDTYSDGIIDTGLWTVTRTDTGGVGSSSEQEVTNSDIEASIVLEIAVTDNTHRAKIVTNNLPALSALDFLKFRAYLQGGGGLDGSPGWILTTSAHLKILGITVKSFNVQDGTIYVDDSVWKAVKNAGGTWDIYDDDVLALSNQTATTNVIEIETYAAYDWLSGTFGGSQTRTIKLYEITKTGGIYLITKNQGGDTMGILFSKLT